MKQETIYDLMIWLFDDLMSENCKKMCEALNYFEHCLISVSAVMGCV